MRNGDCRRFQNFRKFIHSLEIVSHSALGENCQPPNPPVDGSWDLGKECRSWVGGTEDKGEHFMVDCRSGEGGRVEKRVTIVTDAR